MYPVYNQFTDSYPSHHMNQNQNHHHPFPYQSWPHPGYGCPGYHPGYFATPMPACAHAPPMFYGGYPAPPMPYCAMNMPCYSPRNMPESYGYCCGCPNHQQDHTRNDANNVKVEEEGSDSVKKAGGSPVVWIPPGFVKNAAEEQEKEKNHPGTEKERERSEPSDDEKSFLNRLIPLIMEASGSGNPDSSGFAKQGGDSAGKQEHQDADKREFPFPFLWMPCNLNDKSTEMKEKQKIDAGEECRKETAPEKNSVPKVVPVKSVEESTDERPKSSSMKNGNGGKEDGKSSSSPRSSRLPPVCLRVDPVNKKKNGKGSSRSPSPPGDKNKLHELSQASSSKDAEQRETKAKAIDVSEGVTKKDEDKDQNLPKSQVQANESKEVVKSADGSNSSFADNMGGSEKVNMRRNLSEGEAATMIQSAYRGYEVRRWDPLKKLKQISEVRNEVVKLGNGISSDTVNDDKRRIAMDETIMNLLLKLDTIQGLHPSIRDVRKSVARELVSLQEKIDQLSQKKPEIAPDQESDEKLVNDQGGQEKEELTGAHGVHQEVSEGVTSAGEDNYMKILGMDKNDEKTGLASQQPVTEHSDDANDGGTSETELRLETEEINDVQEPFPEVGNVEPENCGSQEQEDKIEMNITEELHGGEEGKIEGENDASKGKDLTQEPQEVLDDGEFPTNDVAEEPRKALVDAESPTNDVAEEPRKALVDAESPTNDVAEEPRKALVDAESPTNDVAEEPRKALVDAESPTNDVAEEPRKALVDAESWKGETVTEDVAKEKDMAEQPLVVLDDGDENVLKASSKAEVLDSILENCTNVTLESHEVPAEAPDVVELDVKDMKEGYISPSSPTSSLGNGDSVSADFNKKLVEENEKLREMMQKLIETGNEQLSTISNLSGRLEDLEKKLSRKNRLKVRGKNHRASRKACRKSMNEIILE